MSLERGDLIAGCRAVLAHVNSEAAKLGYALPTRQYSTVGGSVYDCEQTTVSAMSSAVGIVSPDSNPMNLVGPCDPIWNVTYEVAIVRCAAETVTGPRGESPPTTAAIEIDTDGMSSAYAVLLNVAETMAAADDGVGRVTANVVFGQPEGGLIATVMTLTANLW